MDICTCNVGDKLRMKIVNPTYSHYWKGDKNLTRNDVLTIVSTEFYKKEHGYIIIASIDEYDYKKYCSTGDRRTRRAPFATVVLFKSEFVLLSDLEITLYDAELPETFNDSKLKSFLTDVS